MSVDTDSPGATGVLPALWDIGIVYDDSLDEYVAVRVVELTDNGRAVYPYYFTQYTHKAFEAFEGFVTPDHDEYQHLLKQAIATELKDESKMLVLSEADVERIVSAEACITPGEEAGDLEAGP